MLGSAAVTVNLTWLPVAADFARRPELALVGEADRVRPLAVERRRQRLVEARARSGSGRRGRSTGARGASGPRGRRSVCEALSPVSSSAQGSSAPLPPITAPGKSEARPPVGE